MGLYIVKRDDKEMKEVLPTTFKEIRASERFDLQEWIAKNPDCLCQNDDEKREKLLIIAKEYDDFHNTRERLDLLGLDGNGRLVVIENKLDDSGRDVVWQALKYAAYCSTFKMEQIANAYGRYLKTDAEDAKAKIVTFFGEDNEFGDIKLNPHGNPRIFLIAREFRKEITATALWLFNRQIDIRCYTAIPYMLNGKTFLRVDQLIPPPQADDFMIKVAEKEAEGKASSDTDARRHRLRRGFWKETLDDFPTRGILLYQNKNPGPYAYLDAGAGITGTYFMMGFKYRHASVEIYIDHSNVKEVNEKIFDILERQKDDIERAFGDHLQWRRLEDKRACRIICEKEFPGPEKETWKERINWLADKMPKLEAAVKDRLQQAKDEADAD